MIDESHVSVSFQHCRIEQFGLFVAVDALDTAGDRGEDLIGDSAETLRQFFEGETVTEDNGFVARLRIGASDIDHGKIHTDIAYNRTPLAPHKNFAPVIAHPAVESVGITNRDDSNETVLFQIGVAPITYAFALADGFDREERCLERADIAEGCTSRREAIETDTETAHIVLIISKPFDTGRVEYVFEYDMLPCLFEFGVEVVGTAI